MKQRWPAAVVLSLVTLAAPSTAFAQGLQTGIVTGTVVSSDDAPLPGVTILATSPALLGERIAVTDLNGVYSLAGLPAGSYDLTFDLQDFQLKKINFILEIGFQSCNVAQLTGKRVNPNFILECENKVYLNDPVNGVMVFDQFGTYLRTVPVKGLKSFNVIGNEYSGSICQCICVFCGNICSRCARYLWQWRR